MHYVIKIDYPLLGSCPYRQRFLGLREKAIAAAISRQNRGHFYYGRARL